MADKRLMKSTVFYILLGGLLALLLGAASCGPGSSGLRAFSEKFLDEGHANAMADYGDQLYRQGKIREAYAAYLQAENLAYTYDLQVQCRARRFYVQKQIQALEAGVNTPPAQPQMNRLLSQSEPAKTPETAQPQMAQSLEPPPGCAPSADPRCSTFSPTAAMNPRSARRIRYRPPS